MILSGTNTLPRAGAATEAPPRRPHRQSVGQGAGSHGPGRNAGSGCSKCAAQGEVITISNHSPWSSDGRGWRQCHGDGGRDADATATVGAQPGGDDRYGVEPASRAARQATGLERDRDRLASVTVSSQFAGLVAAATPPEARLATAASSSSRCGRGAVSPEREGAGRAPPHQNTPASNRGNGGRQPSAAGLRIGSTGVPSRPRAVRVEPAAVPREVPARRAPSPREGRPERREIPTK